MNAETLISKVWSFCTTLRDDGVGYGDYLEQLTYLIFLKMADEYRRPPISAMSVSRRSSPGTACAAKRAQSWKGIILPCSGSWA